MECTGLGASSSLICRKESAAAIDVWPNVSFFSHCVSHPLARAAPTNNAAASAPEGTRRVLPPATQTTPLQRVVLSTSKRVGHKIHPVSNLPFLQGWKQARTSVEPDLAMRTIPCWPSLSSKDKGKQERSSNEEAKPVCAHPPPRVRWAEQTNKRNRILFLSFSSLYFGDPYKLLHNMREPHAPRPDVLGPSKRA